VRVNLRRLGFQSQIFRLGSHRGNAVDCEPRAWIHPPAYAGGYEFQPNFSLPTALSGRYDWRMPFRPKGKLPKLDPHRYQGHAVVFWTLTLQDRAQGWLTPQFHQLFREVMLHTAARHAFLCPTYCLMPDHVHLIWMGLRRQSNQLNAMEFLRRELEPALGAGRRWQHQAHDHVLREQERQKDAFAKTCFYILENPVRAGLVSSAAAWPYSGAIVPGYPRLHPLVDGYWERFWKLYAAMREAEPLPASPPPLR